MYKVCTKYVQSILTTTTVNYDVDLCLFKKIKNIFILMDRSKTFIPKGHYDQTNKLYENNLETTSHDVLSYDKKLFPVQSDINNADNSLLSRSNFVNYDKPNHPYTAYDILKDDVTDLFKKLDDMPANQVLIKRANEKTLENTHNDGVTKIDQYGTDRSFIPAKYTAATKPDLLDMNVQGIKDHVVDHTIYINSNNRDIEQYPDPFNYRVDFNPVSGNNNAYIGRLFKNVKYIDIKSVTTPRRYYINKYQLKLYDSSVQGTVNTVTNFLLYNGSNLRASNEMILNSFQLYRGKLINATINMTFYFYYYKITINTEQYYIYRNDLFIDTNCTQRINMQIGTVNTTDIIDAYISMLTTDGNNISVLSVNNGESLNGVGEITNYAVYQPVSVNNSIYMVVVNNKIYDGNYNASTNIPKLKDGTGVKGTLYSVNVGGTQNFGNGSTTFSIGNQVEYDGTRWIKHTDKFQSINFCQKDDVFENIIDNTFELSYTKNGTDYVIHNINNYSLNGLSLEDDRYLLLNIKELDSNYEYTTEQNINNNFSILFPDYINGDYFYLNTSYQDKVFNRGVLGNVKKLTICFRNSSGTSIKVSNANYIDYDIKTPTDRCICTYDSNTGEKVRNYTCSHSYLRHGGYEKLQNTIIIKLGLVEGYQQVLELQSV